MDKRNTETEQLFRKRDPLLRYNYNNSVPTLFTLAPKK